MNVGSLEIELMANVARLQRDMGEARNMLGGLADHATRVAATVRNALGTIGAGIGLRELAALSDQFTKYTAQLKLATQSEREYAQARGDVRRIAAEANAELASTGVLYARIAKGTGELGLSQQRVADITETVALSLKVSGATAQESASAQLQLSQAFAAGALRGEEFNAVNEAAPRLMQALADGIGVPVGALKQMASEGKITSQVMSEALPKALGHLREEGAQVQTIAGAFQLLKNNVVEFVGTQAQSSGVVTAIAGAVSTLASNLQLVAGAAMTVAAVKLGNWLTGTIDRATTAIAANRALAASNLTTAEANATATAQASLLANARLAEVRAATLAAAGEVQLAVATNGLIPAQARAAVAAEAHTAAMAQLAVAQRAASLSTTAASTVLGALGGPIGALITVLGLAATAWSWYQSKQDEANRNAAQDTEQSTAEIVASLEKQNAKLRERIELAKQAGMTDVAQNGGPAAERMASLLVRINALKEQGNKLSLVDQVLLVDLQGLYANLAKQAGDNKGLKATLDATGTAASDLVAVRERLTGVNKQYIEDLKKLQTAHEKGAVSEQEYVRLMTLLATETWKNSEAGKAAATASEKATAERKKELELMARLVGVNSDYMDELSRLQKLRVSQNMSEERYVELVTELVNKQPGVKAALEAQAKATEQVAAFNKQYYEGLSVTQKLLEDQIASATKEAERNEQLARTFGMTTAAIEAQELARLQDQLAQRSSLGLTAEEIDTLEKLIDAKKRSTAALASVEQQEANKKAFDQMVEDAKRSSEQISQSLTDNIMRGGKSAAEYLKDLFRTLVLRPILSPIGNFVGATLTGAMMPAAAQAGTLGTITSSLGGIGSMISGVGSLFGASTISGFGSGLMAGLQYGTGAEAMMASAAGAGNLAAGAASGVSIGSTISSAIAAIPGWGWAALGAAAIGAWLMDDGPEKDTRLTFGSNNRTGNVNINDHGNEGKSWLTYLSDQSNSAFGTFGVTGGFWADTHSKQISDFVATVGKVDDALASLMTNAEKAKVTANLSAISTTIHTGEEGSDPNANGQLDSVFAQRIRAILDGVSPGLSNLVAGFKGTSQELATEAEALLKYRQALRDSGEAIFGVQVTLQQVAALANSGEKASDALVRVTSLFQATNAVALALGKTTEQAFGAIGLASYNARNELARAAGGVDQLGQLVGSYAQNFLSESQRLAPLAKIVDETLAKLGYAGISTRDQFANIVAGLDLTTEQGRNTFVSLMQIQDAFAQLHPVIEANNEEVKKRYDLETELLRALGNEVGAVARERSAELDALDASLRPLQLQVWMLQDLAKAQDAALAAVERAIDAEKKAKQAAYQQTIDGINTAMDTVKSKLSDLTSLSNALHTALGGMNGGDATLGLRRDQARAQVEAALAIVRAGGVLPKADTLQEALSTLSENSTGLYSTFAEWQRDQLRTAASLTELANLTDNQVTDQQRQLEALQALKDATEAAHNADIERLDGILDAAQAQLDALRGVDKSVLSVSAAVANLSGLIAAAQTPAVQQAQLQALSGINQSVLSATAMFGGSQQAQLDALGGINQGVQGIVGAFSSYAAAVQTAVSAQSALVQMQASLDQAQTQAQAAQVAAAAANANIAGLQLQVTALQAQIAQLQSAPTPPAPSDIPYLPGRAPDDWRYRRFEDYYYPDYMTVHSDPMASNAANGSGEVVAAAVADLRAEIAPALAKIASYTNRIAVSNEDMNYREMDATA